MIRNLFFFIFISSVTFAAGDSDSRTNINLSWPVDVSKNFKISSTFGESRMDHFHNGVDIPGKGVSVYPVQRGRIIWKKDAVMRPGDIPFGGGKTIIMDHDGYWSGYMHLIQFNPEALAQQTVEREMQLGKSGDTGHSGGAHLHFFIFDPVTKRMINPLPYLSQGPYKNPTPPRVMGYGALVQNEFVTINAGSTFTMSHEFPIYARIIDSGTGNEKWGIYTFESYSDSEMKNPIQKLVFNYIKFEDNHWKTSNGKSFEDVYFENWMNLGSGFKKTKKIIWKAAGYLGPEYVENIDLKIKE